MKVRRLFRDLCVGLRLCGCAGINARSTVVENADLVVFDHSTFATMVDVSRSPCPSDRLLSSASYHSIHAIM